ncbi:PAQR family membrane homeostasis protein TrhA [Arcanobacterium canis]
MAGLLSPLSYYPSLPDPRGTHSKEAFAGKARSSIHPQMENLTRALHQRTLASSLEADTEEKMTKVHTTPKTSDNDRARSAMTSLYPANDVARPGSAGTVGIDTRVSPGHTSASTSSVKTLAHMNRAERKAFLASGPKPKARGWIHAITAPLALANGILLVIFAPTVGRLLAAIVFMIAGLILFGNSAVYHLGPWAPKVKGILQKIDHSNIFILIAGTYTPLSVSLLSPSLASLVLGLVWGGAAIGMSMAIFWPSCPRWLSTLNYVLLGWVAVWFIPYFYASGGPAIVWLIAAGGIAYTIGALFYATRWPNPWPVHFGFHEFFHTGTAIGYSCHCVATWLAILS